MTIDEYVGKRIKAKRVQHKLTQDELAVLVGVDRTYVCQVERGKKSLTVRTLKKFKIALRVSYSYFFSGSDANS